MSLSPVKSGGTETARGDCPSPDGTSALQPIPASDERKNKRVRKQGSQPYGYTLKKLSQLRALGQDKGITFTSSLTRLYKATCARVEWFGREVRECKCVEDATWFCEFVRWEMLPVFAGLEDGRCRSLEERLKAVLDVCHEHAQGRKPVMKYAASDIAEINRRMDEQGRQLALIASILAKPVVTVSPSSEPLKTLATSVDTGSGGTLALRDCVDGPEMQVSLQPQHDTKNKPEP